MESDNTTYLEISDNKNRIIQKVKLVVDTKLQDFTDKNIKLSLNAPNQTLTLAQLRSLSNIVEELRSRGGAIFGLDVEIEITTRNLSINTSDIKNINIMRNKFEEPLNKIQAAEKAAEAAAEQAERVLDYIISALKNKEGDLPKYIFQSSFEHLKKNPTLIRNAISKLRENELGKIWSAKL